MDALVANVGGLSVSGSNTKTNPKMTMINTFGQNDKGYYFYLLPKRAQATDQKIHTLMLQTVVVSGEKKTTFETIANGGLLVFMNANSEIEIAEEYKNYYAKQGLSLPEEFINIQIIEVTGKMAKVIKTLRFSYKLINDHRYTEILKEAMKFYGIGLELKNRGMLN